MSKEAIAEIIEYLKYEIEELESIKDKIEKPICEKIKDNILFYFNLFKK